MFGGGGEGERDVLNINASSFWIAHARNLFLQTSFLKDSDVVFWRWLVELEVKLVAFVTDDR